MRRRVAAVAGAAGALVVGAEVLARRSSTTRGPAPGSRVGLVALGYPARRDGSAPGILRWRVERAVDLARRYDAAVVVMSGGAARNHVVEADVMLDLARGLGIDDERLRAERVSRSTWQNVKESAHLVWDCDAVVLVSDPMHARRARRYWCAQFPDDAGRVFAASERRPFEHWWLAVPAALYECAVAVGERVGGRPAGGG